MKKLVVVLAAAVLFTGCSSDAEPEGSAATDPTAQEPLAVLEIPAKVDVYDPVVAFDAAWVYGVAPDQGPPEAQIAGVPDPRTFAVYRVDEKSGAVTDTISVANGGTSLAALDGALWMGSTTGRVSRIDPDTKQVTGEIKAGGEVWSLSPGEGALWATGVTDPQGDRNGVLFRIDPRTGTSETVSAGDNAGVIDAVAAGEGWVWAVINDTPLDGKPVGRIVRIDPTTKQIAGETKVSGLVVGAPVPAKGGAWILKRAPEGGLTMLRVEGDGKLVDAPKRSAVPDHGLGGSLLGGMWGFSSSPEDGLLAVRYDPSSGKVLEQRQLAGPVAGELLDVAVGSEDLWVGTYTTGGGLARVGPF